MSDIADTLAERGSRYGSFREHARITQAIKAACADSPNWTRLAPDQREVVEMIAHKLGRILNGDPDFHDSWHDIVGYAKLVADRLPHSAPDRVAESGALPSPRASVTSAAIVEAPASGGGGFLEGK